MLANDSTRFLSFELCNLNLALPVLVLTGLLHTIISLLDKVKRLWHILPILHHLLELALVLIDIIYLLFGIRNVSLLFQKAGRLGSFVLPE